MLTFGASYGKWAMRRHPNKGTGSVKNRYFRVQVNRTWAFTARTTDRAEIRLFRATMILIVRPVKIRGQANPFDPGWSSYFARRAAKIDD